jgi:hypothetical protein
MYSRINSINSPASGAGNASDPGLMSQVGSEHKVVCVYVCEGISPFGAVEMSVLVCLRSNCSHVTEVACP